MVLYEMIAGRLPFQGVNALDVISAILQREPAPLSPHVADVPLELENLIGRTLRKDRERRYQTARELLTDLEELIEKIALSAKLQRPGRADKADPPSASAKIIPASHSSAAPALSSTQILLGEAKRRKLGVGLMLVLLLAGAALGYYGFFVGRGGAPILSLAVLPFANVSGDPDTEYLADGLTESIIFNLSRVARLKVVPRSSVVRYWEKDKDPRTAGSELGVGAVLAGRIVQRGGDLSVSAELIEVGENRVLWGEQYHRKLDDALALQQTISKEISERLQLRLSGEEANLVARSYTDNNEAYQLYLKGSYHYGKFVELEPFSLRTCLNAGYIYLNLGRYDRVREQGRKCVEMDPNFYGGHALIGLEAEAQGRYEQAASELEKTVELGAGTQELASLGFLYGVMGQQDKAQQVLDKLMKLSTQRYVRRFDIAVVYLGLGKMDRAFEWREKSYQQREGALTAIKGIFAPPLSSPGPGPSLC